MPDEKYWLLIDIKMAKQTNHVSLTKTKKNTQNKLGKENFPMEKNHVSVNNWRSSEMIYTINLEDLGAGEV